jgi:diacylglycerol O-acyltransferase-1
LGNYGLYKLFVWGRIGKRVLLVLHFLFLVLFCASGLYLKWHLTPLFALISIMNLFVYALKMHSYIATNLLLHEKVTKRYEEVVGSTQPLPTFYNLNLMRPVDAESTYPNNINIKNYLYYTFCAPSLVYETKFLLTTHIRPAYVLKELLKFVFCACSIATLISQFILPVTTMQSGDSIKQVLADIFALCVPSVVIWLLAIYAYFGCWLNARSELVRYANREFYKDWWNADSIRSFWRKWNTRAHEWCLRHVYVESIYYYNVSKDTASTMVFFGSIITHELFFSYAFKAYHPFFLLIMIGQVPLLYLNIETKNSKRIGNCLMWISLLIGQPLLEILYFRAWMSSRYNNELSFWCG